MRVIVDRIENGYAVCELENGSFQTFPMSELPAGCLEGSVLIWEDSAWELDLSAEIGRKEKVQHLLDSLFEN